MTSTLTASVLPFGALTKGDVHDWTSLLMDRPINATPFHAPEFARVVDTVWGRVFVCKIAEEGRPVAFFPYQFKTQLHQSLRIGTRLGGELSDYFGVVAKLGFAINPDRLLRHANLNALFFTHLDETQVGAGLSGESPEIGHRIEFPEGGPRFWEDRRRTDKKFTADTERRERSLVQKFGMLRFSFRDAKWRDMLPRLISAKRKQYARTGASDALHNALTQEFLALLAESKGGPCCSAALSTLHAGDTWVASHFGLICGSTLHYWFPVYNSDLNSFSPGRLLLKAIIDNSKAIGLSTIDRGAGDSVAKRDFATSNHYFYRGFWGRRNAISFAYRGGLSANWRAKRWFRNRSPTSN